MFNLCKTQIIYKNVNHYHVHHHAPSTTLIDPTEVHYQEHLSPPSSQCLPSSSHHGTADTHLSYTRRRSGISLSIKDNSPAEVISHSHRHTLSALKPQTLTQHNTRLTDSHPHKSQLNQVQPKIVESKITWVEVSPPLHHSHPHPFTHQIRHKPSMALSELPVLTATPLKRGTTDTTKTSQMEPVVDLTEAKMEAREIKNPLKKSSSFLRSSGRSKCTDSMKNSIEFSLLNSQQHRITASLMKRQEHTESLLRLSCSSYSQVLQNKSPMSTKQQLPQASSVELKRQQFSLGAYAEDAGDSIIFTKPVVSREMKNVQSNYDLLSESSQLSESEFKPTYSGMLEPKYQSPVDRLKRKYGDNMLSPYDKETIISRSFVSHQRSSTPIIDESFILSRQIQNNFTPVQGFTIQTEQYKLFLGVERRIGLLCSIKQIPICQFDRVQQELALQHEIEAKKIQGGVLQLYQVYTHGEVYLIAKQPHQISLLRFIASQHSKYKPNWDHLLSQVTSHVENTLNKLEQAGMRLTRRIELEDLVLAAGEWKLHSPDMLEVEPQECMAVSEALKSLREQIIRSISLLK